MEQVLLNLVVNARDAMPHGGRVVIETRRELLESPEAVTADLVEPGEYELAVGDQTTMLTVDRLGSVTGGGPLASVFDRNGDGKITGSDLRGLIGMLRDGDRGHGHDDHPGRGWSDDGWGDDGGWDGDGRDRPGRGRPDDGHRDRGYGDD
jgi:hypothetical protein